MFSLHSAMFEENQVQQSSLVRTSKISPRRKTLIRGNIPVVVGVALGIICHQGFSFDNKNVEYVLGLDVIQKLMGYTSTRKRSRPNPAQSVEKQISRGKALASVIAFLWFTKSVYKDGRWLVVVAELVRLAGLGCLVHKICREENCTGLSFKSQMITAMFLFVRLYCSSVMQQEVHVFMDFFTLVVTVWVLCKMHFKLRSTYSKELDNSPLHYLLAPCAILSIILHPRTAYPLFYRTLWAFSVYLETIQVLPQLNLMQSIKVIEPHTAHYVFALGVSRLLNCTYFVIRIVEGNKHLFKIVGPGVWPGMTMVCQIVSIFMMGDFSYYYIKSLIDGQRLVQLPV